MLFKISLKNISKSLKDYTVYFFTLILGVAIFYVFNAEMEFWTQDEYKQFASVMIQYDGYYQADE